MTNPTDLCLVLIVKNEALVIERLIESARPHITSWCILDTGSTDGTQDVIRTALSDLPGKLMEKPWVDFAHNRSQVMAEATKMTDGWMLMMDADFTVEYEPGLLEALAEFDTEQGLLLIDNHHRLPMLARTGIPWYYVGRVHEYMTADVPFNRKPFDHIRLTHHADGGSRVGRHAQDVKLLEQDVADDPTNTRSVFYLAQSYRDTGDIERAAEAYRIRATMGGWDEEVYMALFQAGVMEERLEDPNSVLTLEAAWELRPSRAEATHQLARHHRIAGNIRLAWLWAYAAYNTDRPDDILFVYSYVYDWAAAFEYTDALWRNGAFGEAEKVAHKTLKSDLPDDYRNHLEMILKYIEDQRESNE